LNFTKISKSYIEKDEINACIEGDELNWNKLSIYIYKIASIVSNNFGFNSSCRDDYIQDAVCVSYYRRGSFDVKKNNCVYSYFYKVIKNHYKDILRKKYRRTGIATMVSYEKATEDNIDFSSTISYANSKEISSIEYVPSSSKTSLNRVVDEKKQTYFISFEKVNR
jgi:hypothetical protein